LATNATKYGALSIDEGAVEIEWKADDKDIRLQWREAGGPATKPPKRQGNGVRLIKATIEQLKGGIEYDWHPEGLTAHMRLPIASLGN
jgi:two-component sensor histidine kinase